MRLGTYNEPNSHSYRGRAGGVADSCDGAKSRAEARLTRRNRGLEYSHHSEAGLLPASGAVPESVAVEAAQLYAEMHEAIATA